MIQKVKNFFKALWNVINPITKKVVQGTGTILESIAVVIAYIVTIIAGIPILILALLAGIIFCFAGKDKEFCETCGVENPCGCGIPAAEVPNA